MTTLQDSPQIDHSQDQRYRQDQGFATATMQSQQQQQNDEMPQADRQQSGDEQTFTVSLDDWFKS